MKVRREKFLAAAIALGASAAGCDLSTAIASRISPEKPEEGVTSAAPAPAANDEPGARRGDPDHEGSGRHAAGVTRTPSPTFEGSALPSPTKEAGLPSPTKEVGLPSPTKEAGLPSPTKEAGMPSPTKEWGMPSPTKER